VKTAWAVRSGEAALEVAPYASAAAANANQTVEARIPWRNACIGGTIIETRFIKFSRGIKIRIGSQCEWLLLDTVKM